jgi:uracil phosphoribosyltransferase
LHRLWGIVHKSLLENIRKIGLLYICSFIQSAHLIKDMFVFTQQPSIANHFLAELRDAQTQTDSMRFRRNLERLGELMAYEISKTFAYQSRKVQTPLGLCHTKLITEQPVLATILRAGLPLYQGFLNVFDNAESAFIGAYRGHSQADESFEIQLEYMASPDLNGKTLILIDPMLATGRSVVKTYQALLRYGKPAHTHLVAAIGSQEGVNFLQSQLPDCQLWLGDLDSELNDKFYIVPGLGDAGDLAFGNKL